MYLTGGYEIQKILLNSTHVHADHITGSGLIKKSLNSVKSVISEGSQAKADVFVNDGSISFKNLNNFFKN